MRVSRWDPPLVRLLTGITKNENGCWLYAGQHLDNGYGLMMMARKQIGAHRVSWILHRGDIPKGMHVCHRCDIRLCINPDHLFLGTPKDNEQDKLRKGRQRNQNKGKTACKRGHALNGGNVYVTTQGGRGCKTCKKQYWEEYKHGMGRRRRHDYRVDID